jgi:gamma-glutamylcyclotransferase (GGCT)/AIG2-like uncharacterized protein YtfP
VEFRLFAYGTLKHDASAHARYCATALRWTRATTRGRLYEHEEGYPVLIVPRSAVYALGTRDASADARATLAHARASILRPDALARTQQLSSSVHGEVLIFETRRLPLAELDEYEGYRPDQPSMFVRALVDVAILQCGTISKAWTYVAGAVMPRRALAALPTGVWRG